VVRFLNRRLYVDDRHNDRIYLYTACICRRFIVVSIKVEKGVGREESRVRPSDLEAEKASYRTPDAVLADLQNPGTAQAVNNGAVQTLRQPLAEALPETRAYGAVSSSLYMLQKRPVPGTPEEQAGTIQAIDAVVEGVKGGPEHQRLEAAKTLMDAYPANREPVQYKIIEALFRLEVTSPSIESFRRGVAQDGYSGRIRRAALGQASLN